MEESLEVNLKRKKWVFFLRQLMICSGVWTTFFMVGQFMGAPTVFIPQLRKDSVELDDDMTSWLYSVFGFAAVPWLFILSALTRTYGLRIPYIIGCLGLLLAYIVFYFSSTPLQILISEIIFGTGYASVLTVGLVIVSEYTSPEYRGIFLTFKSASFFWGLWCSNTIGTFFHWKNIAYSGFLCAAYTFSFIFWPESPQWLASNRRFDECRKSYYWLQGYGEKSEKEVKELIDSQVKLRKTATISNNWSNFSTAIETVTSKEFYAPVLLTIVLVTQYHFTGKIVCTIFIVDILKNMTDSESTAYIGMLILDGVTIFSMYTGCFLSKIIKRRTLYLTSSFTAIAFLFLISLYMYLVKLTVIEENKVISMLLLICFSIAISFGPMIMNTSIYIELIPLKFKRVIVLIASLVFYVLLTVVLKVAPYIFKSFGLHGSFLFYGIVSGVCTILLYKYLPETKDKTLQEIELYFKTYNMSDSETERFK